MDAPSPPIAPADNQIPAENPMPAMPAENPMPVMPAENPMPAMPAMPAENPMPAMPADNQVVLGGIGGLFLARYSSAIPDPTALGCSRRISLSHTDINDPIRRIWSTPVGDSKPMRESIWALLAADRWSLVALFRPVIDNGPECPVPNYGRNTVFIAVNPGSTTVERAGEIIRETWLVLKK